MKPIKFDILPQRSALLADRTTEMYALFRAQGPTLPATGAPSRKPLNLALVLDRSGSMRGQPLEEAKRCAHHVIDQLSERDRLSLVVYDNTVEVLLTSSTVLDKPALKIAVNAIVSGGSTNLFGGWKAGAEQCLFANTDDYISRVLLLSDGCANRGLTDTQKISQSCAEMAARGVSTSTYGLGHQFNEELMVAIANAGEGQSYYGESAEDLMDPFQEEFSLLSSVCARHLELHIYTPRDVQVELLNEYKQVGSSAWQLKDLSYEGEVWAMVKMTIAENIASTVADGKIEILKATLGYTALDGGNRNEEIASLRLPRVAAQVWASLVEDECVNARVQEVRVAQLQRKVQTAAMREDWYAVDELLRQAELEAGNNAWLLASLDALKRYTRRRDRARTSKEARYSSERMLKRMAALDERASEYSDEVESEKLRHLRRKQEQGKQMY